MLFAKIITQEVIKGAGKFKDNFLKFLKYCSGQRERFTGNPLPNIIFKLFKVKLLSNITI